MKKILSLILVACFAVSLIGCGSGETKKTETKKTETTTTTGKETKP